PPYVGCVGEPEGGFCSGPLLSPTVFLTAGHCTYYFSQVTDVVYLSFDPQVTSTSTFYTSHEWYSHPDYVDADWPYTQDFGIVILDQPVSLDQYGVLPEVGLLAALIPASGQTQLRFTDVGYGQTGVTVGGGPPQANFPLERRQAVQRYAPGGEGGIGHGLTDLFLFLQNVPSEPHGSACGGDSGSPGFLGATNQLVGGHPGGRRRRPAQPGVPGCHHPARRGPHRRLPARPGRGHLRPPDLAEPPAGHRGRSGLDQQFPLTSTRGRPTCVLDSD